MEKKFYKNDNGFLLYGTQIENKNYILKIENVSEYNLPIDGWHYFETEEIARNYLDCPFVEIE